LTIVNFEIQTMKITKYPIMLLAGVAAMFASCDDKEATQPTAAISVDKYHYEVNFLPEMIIPVTITMND